ncbi:hypothetical protein J1614_002909 [Plenodomus biglobosus]|nr:hypothetical protein J1614_002909 [Plenodomus biglobosus]
MIKQRANGGSENTVWWDREKNGMGSDEVGYIPSAFSSTQEVPIMEVDVSVRKRSVLYEVTSAQRWDATNNTMAYSFRE